MATPVLLFGDLSVDPDAQRDRGSRLAGGLLALGLRQGDAVAVLLRNCAEYADVIHACRIAGIFYSPVNWHFTPDEIGAQILDCGAKAVIGHADLLEPAARLIPEDLPVLAVGAGGPTHAREYESWLSDQPGYAGPEVSPRGHLAFTSGTTGRPKVVVREPIPLDELPARQSRIRQVVERTFGLRPGCRALLPAPLYHSAPSLFMQNALTMADLVVLLERFDPEAVLSAIERHRIDTVYLVPIMYVRLLRLPEEVRARYDVSSVRFVASTGAPCAPDVKRAMIHWFGPVIHETYASSEAGMITSIGSQEAIARPGSSGRPVLDAQIRILREDGQPCDAGEVGLIYVRQPAYPDFTYKDNEQARRAIDRDGLITLGDMGYLDADGYLYVCDRASDMVVSGGVNIYPAEIENQLMNWPAVADCAVVGVPDPEFGERLHAVVEVLPGTELVASEAIDWMRERLASYKVPRTVEIAALPRDDNGKIAKRRLRERYWADQARRV